MFQIFARRVRLTSSFVVVTALALAACSSDGGESDSPAPTETIEDVAPVDTADETTPADTTADTTPVDTADASGDGAGIDDAEAADPVSWTFMVYMVADTDLEPFALEDLTEMAGVGSQDEVNIVTLVDRSSDYTDDGVLGLDDWQSAKMLRMLPGGVEEIADLGEINMGDPANLSQFVIDATSQFPADHYALTVWDHGGGWVGIGPDESDEDILELPEIVTALTDGLGAAGIDQLDLLGFDACLMATYEVASALAPFTQYLVASQEVEPGHGWDYGSLDLLVQDPATDGSALGSAIIDGFDAQAKAEGTDSDVTLSLIDMAAMPALDAAMAEFAGALGEQIDGLSVAVGRQRVDTLEYGKSENPEQSTQLADLGVFVGEIGVQSLQISDQADAVIRSIGDAVIDRTAGPARLGSTGLSIYFPPTADLFDSSYPVDDVDGAAMWNQFLSAYHGAGDAIAEGDQAAFEAADSALEIFDVDGGVSVEAALDAASVANVVSATITYGIVDDDTGEILLLGDDEATISDDGIVVGFSDLTVFTIGDGENTLEAYLSLTSDEESGLSTASIPLVYFAPDSDEGEDVELSITIDSETGDVIDETYFVVGEDGTWGELSADSAGRIVPVLPTVADDDGETEWVTFDGPGLSADIANLSYDVTPLDPGTSIYVELDVEDYGGNVAVLSGQFDI